MTETVDAFETFETNCRTTYCHISNSAIFKILGIYKNYFHIQDNFRASKQQHSYVRVVQIHDINLCTIATVWYGVRQFINR
jgi:hypothetical protein